MIPATILFALAAVGGATMAVLRLRGAARPPDWLTMLHGLLAAAGLVLLLNAYFTVGLPGMAQLALLLFLLAAAGGAYINLGFHSKQLPLPIPLMLGHAALAVVGFLLLLVCVVQTR
jgi:hypothetical protein